VLTVDGSSGRVLWDANLASPIVAMYLVEGDGLHRLPFTVIGRETLHSLIQVRECRMKGGMLEEGRERGESVLIPQFTIAFHVLSPFSTLPITCLPQ
jgi:hypothetical protein